MHLQFFTFVIANLLCCGSDIYFGFFDVPTKKDSHSATRLMEFIEIVAILLPINYVLIVHRKALIRNRLTILTKFVKKQDYENLGERNSQSINLSKL